jgi:hypothetical protein
MDLPLEFNWNQSYLREDRVPNSYVNDEFLLVFGIHLLTFFFICRYIAKHYIEWSSFFFTGWLFIAEFCILSFISAAERNVYFDLYLYFYTSYFFIIALYLLSFYFRFIIMFLYTFSKYTHIWFKGVIDEHIYQLSKHFFTKNPNRIINKYIYNFFMKKKIFTYFFIGKDININKNILNYALNKRYYLFIYILSFFYIIFIILLIYYFIITINKWYDHSLIDLPVIYYRYKSCFFLVLYYIIFLKLILNSLCFNQLFSKNFLRLVNFSKQSDLSDDLMDWEPSFFETIVINEELTPEDTSLYLMNDFCAAEDILDIFDFWDDLDSEETLYRFRTSSEWLKCKTYVIDSYDNNPFQNINILIGNIIEKCWEYDDEDELLFNIDIEKNLYLKI